MTHHTRVKICGITSPEEAQMAEAFGADAIGLVFFDKSPRNVDVKKAKAIAESVGPFVNVVALFVNAAFNTVKQAIHEVPVQCLQFHGDEDAKFCEQFDMPYLKAIKVPRPAAETESAISAVQQQVVHVAQTHPKAKAILLDTLHAQHHGGTGTKFDWRCVPSTEHFLWILAGGLNPQNVNDAITQVQPYAVDVSSGVESAPAIKDPRKVQEFIRQVKRL